MRSSLSFLVLAACLAGAPVLAQTEETGRAGGLSGPGVAPPGSVGSTRTGEAPEKTGSTTAIGQTKPPGQAVGDGLGTRPDLEDKSRDLTRRIQNDICKGCD